MAAKKNVANAGKDSRKVHGSEKKTDLHLFDPDKLTLVDDAASDLYDRRVHEPSKEKFILNIMALGVHTPIKVVFGRKRTLALREANRRLRARGDDPKLISATILHSKPAGAIGMMISENEHREEDTTSNRAEKAARMVDRGASLEDVGNAFGLETAQVKNLLAFNNASAYVRKAVEDEKVTLSNGIKAAKVWEKEGPEAGRKLIDTLIAEAPRTPGKKRSPNSRKAREIVEGGPVMHSKKEIVEMRARLKEQGDAKDPCVAAMAAMAAWVLGESTDLDFARVQLEVVPPAKVASA
jgi:ParB family chromosome partitioning protein